MNFAELLSLYLTLNFLVVLGFLFSLMLSFKFSASQQLKLNYLLIGSLLFVTFLTPLVPKSEVFEPIAKIWTATSSKQNFWGEFSIEKNGGYLSVSPISDEKMVSTKIISNGWAITGIFVLFFGGLYLFRDLRALARIRRKSFLIKRNGHVYIYLNDELTVPYSYWLPKQSVVVIPAALLTKRSEYKMAVLHELQHHRQHDTKWIYFLWLLKLVCVVNPFSHLWFRRISEIQEFACDETLVDQQKVESHAYARCLFQVAESAVGQKFNPACATGLTFLTERSILKRRIEQMFNLRKAVNKSWSVALVITAWLGFFGTAYAMNGIVEDQRVTLAQATEWAGQAQAKIKASGSDFPIVMNEEILKQLNRAVGTPQGREYIKKALARMNSYLPMLERKFATYHAPKELLAIPVVESGYRNLPEETGKHYGAGIWMFIKSTAQNFGLVVDENQDDRLNPELETDAALRLLLADRLRFQDWQLAILGYNAGESQVQKALDSCKAVQANCGAWELLARGLKTDRDYLPKVMAGVILLNK